MTTPLRQSSAQHRAETARPPGRTASRFYDISVALVAALPVAMVVANRSSPLLLGLAALAALAGAAAEGRFAELRRRAAGWFAAPLGAAVLAALLWAALSLAWSPMLLVSLHVLGEFVLPIAAALIVILALPDRVDAGRWSIVAAGAAVLAGALVVADMQSGMVLREELGRRSAPYVLNRPALTLLVLLPGLALLVARHHRPWLLACLVAVIAFAIARSVSGASKLGLMTALGIFAFAWIARRATFAFVTLALLVSIAVAPVLGDLADRFLPAPLVRRLEQAHAQDRIDIWRSFGAAVRESPWVGAGLGTSGRFGAVPVAARVAPEFRPLLDVGHPHDAPLQVWAELGCVGAALAALLASLTLRLVAGLSGFAFAAALALIGACLAVWLVGQGAWQGWWPAGIGASILWFRLALQRER